MAATRSLHWSVAMRDLRADRATPVTGYLAARAWPRRRPAKASRLLPWLPCAWLACSTAPPSWASLLLRPVSSALAAPPCRGRPSSAPLSVSPGLAPRRLAVPPPREGAGMRQVPSRHSAPADILAVVSTILGFVILSAFLTALWAASLPQASSRRTDCSACGKPHHDRLPGLPADLLG